MRTKLKDIPTLHKHGGDRKSDQDSKNENGILNPRGGNNQPYRIAKLKRDYPAIAERLLAGEFANVREAERAAGGGRCQPWLTKSPYNYPTLTQNFDDFGIENGEIHLSDFGETGERN